MKTPDLTVILPILQGLLASGDYTSLDQNHNPYIDFTTHGESWEKDGHVRKITSTALDDAVDLAYEVIERLEHESELDKEAESD